MTKEHNLDQIYVKVFSQMCFIKGGIHIFNIKINSDMNWSSFVTGINWCSSCNSSCWSACRTGCALLLIITEVSINWTSACILYHYTILYSTNCKETKWQFQSFTFVTWNYFLVFLNPLGCFVKRGKCFSDNFFLRGMPSIKQEIAYLWCINVQTTSINWCRTSNSLCWAPCWTSLTLQSIICQVSISWTSTSISNKFTTWYWAAYSKG